MERVRHLLVMDPEVLRTMISQPGSMSKLTIIEISYFAAYEVTKKALTPTGSSASELNLGAIILAGGTAGVAMWSLAIPPDVSLVSDVLFRTLIGCNRCSNRGCSPLLRAHILVSSIVYERPSPKMVSWLSGKDLDPPWLG